MSFQQTPVRYKPTGHRHRYGKSSGVDKSKFSKTDKLPGGITVQEFIDKYEKAKLTDIFATGALYGSGAVALVAFVCGLPWLGVLNAAICAGQLLSKKHMKEYRENKEHVYLFRDLYDKLVQDLNDK